MTCALTVTLNVSVGVAFADINECETNRHACAAEAAGGQCVNLPGGHRCDCRSGFSGDGETCEADKTIFLLPAPGGALSAGRAGDPEVRDRETVPRGATVTFTATPDSGHHVSGWTGACAGSAFGGHDDERPKTCEVVAHQDAPVGATFADTNECDAPAAGANAHDCGANSICGNEPGGFSCACENGFHSESGKACGASEEICGELGKFYDGTKCVDAAACSGGKVPDPDTNLCVCREPTPVLSLDGTACEAGAGVVLIPSQYGAISAGWSGDATVSGGERVPRGAMVTFTATPEAGYHVYEWLEDCEGSPAGDHDDENVKTCALEALAGMDFQVRAVFRDTNECDAAAAGVNAHNCGARSACGNEPGGFRCDCDAGFYPASDGRACGAGQALCGARGEIYDGTKCAACDEVPNTAPNAANDKCVCETAGHRIFGDAPDRRCAAPAICPDGYAGEDCAPHPRGGKMEADMANAPSTCEKIFGGYLRDDVICSRIDINDTFCIAGSLRAFPCAGLYEHVRLCNSMGRPALDPWHCGAVCDAGKMARGRKCETVE